MSWSISRMARYVQNIKFLQNLKDHEEICSEAFEKGSYLLFCNDKPFLAPKEPGNALRNKINWRSFKGMVFLDRMV